MNEYERERIKENTEDYLHKMGINTKRNFKCLNPAHNDDDPSMSYDKANHQAHCFGCGAKYDVIDLIMIHEHKDFKEAVDRACELYGITNTQNKTPYKSEIKPVEKQKTADEGKHQPAPETDYTSFYTQCSAHLLDTDYLSKRGIDEEIAFRFNLGYCKDWKNPKAPKAPATERLIIPTGKFSYVARAIKEGDEPRYCKVGTAQVFGLDTLQEYKEPVYIVEGELDAISILQCGYPALGLGSAENYRKLLAHLEKNKTDNPFVIALDNDEAGRKATAELKAGLDKQGLKSVVFNPYREYKDANEALRGNIEHFRADLAQGQALAIEELEKEKNEYLNKESARAYIDTFFEDTRKNTKCVKTGFRQLDTVLDGGLYEGLYVIGAISSLGKTTFVLQLADQIARQGQDVLIFSLEQSRYELMAKSISRLTAEIAKDTPAGISRLAKSARDILVYERLNNSTDEQLEVFYEAQGKYREISEHIFITESVGATSVNDIKKAVEKHIRITGNTPVVVIDYLQILAPFDDRRSYTDKQITDLSVSMLRRITREYKLITIGISSFNRESYTAPVSLASFKESGTIEYSADVLIGLQLKGAGDTLKGSASSAKVEGNSWIENEVIKDPREIELKLLKARNAQPKAKVEYIFYPKYNYFVEQ